MPFNGQAVINLREREGLTQSRLGKLIGVTPQQIHNYECGNSSPKVAVLDILYQVAKDRKHTDLEFYERPQ